MLFMTLFAIACSDVKDPHSHDAEEEVITRVVLTLSDSTGTLQEFTWTDPENDGDPVVDELVFSLSETYDVEISFWNDLSDPSEEITPEIIDEAEEHQVFTLVPDFMAVQVMDFDGNGLDLGLEQEWTFSAVGSDTISIGLRHMPDQDGEPVKTEGLDVDNLPGEWDTLVDFPITVE